MYQGRRVSVIIGAAGKGTRMGTSTPKQFLRIGEKTILEKTCDAFNRDYIDEILVVSSEDIKGFKTVIGGAERQDSIYNGINALEHQDIVLVHDGVRPFVDEETIIRVIEGVIEEGACICAVRPKDTVRTEEETLKRDELFLVQTPQGFTYDLLKEAYDKAFSDGFYGTDDASLVERLGRKVKIVKGSYENIKITTKEDLKKTMRVGTGFDVHRLVEGRKLILGGVEIPYEKGLLGHSDADVLVHAFMDAILGAAALGDIGKHFPDTDERYKDISSIKLLEHVMNLIREEGYTFVNGDITVIAQRPKIASYIPKMKEVMAEAMAIDTSLLNIKGTTTEELGFTGRGEGIAAQATCMLER
ncbi:MAG: 2-C-methyl-D-erythritol 2,4-cyclodiphosphate synthase [Clostridia bacterium]|nr:2-C-methyl-D-erythritol 2,4-cyclodiphosphate synthase [Clostridia bacterium]